MSNENDYYCTYSGPPHGKGKFQQYKLSDNKKDLELCKEYTSVKIKKMSNYEKELMDKRNIFSKTLNYM